MVISFQMFKIKCTILQYVLVYAVLAVILVSVEIILNCGG